MTKRINRLGWWLIIPPVAITAAVALGLFLCANSSLLPSTAGYGYLTAQYDLRLNGAVVLLMLLLFLLMVAATIYYLTSWSQRRKWLLKMGLDAERNRITADLHDEIGSTLSSLQLYGRVAHKLIDQDPEKAKEIITQIMQNSADVSENIADIIWSLKTDDEHNISLEGRIKNHVHNVLSHANIDYEVYVIRDLLNDHSAVLLKRNIFFIIKEGVTNILKYANATKVKIWFFNDTKDYTLLIEDDGQGFDPDETFGKGNGLLNMKKRTEELNGVFQIESDKGKGTKIICSLPIRTYR